MLDYIFSKLPKSFTSLPRDKVNKIFLELEKKYPEGEDPWGLNLNRTRKAIKYGYPVYKNYFRARVIGKKNVPDRPYMVVANHTGQIPFDGMAIYSAFLFDIWPPRILRVMAERFVTSLPFFNSFISENGAVLGDRSNCYHLLKRGESILVFPEGVRGISKNTEDFYKVQSFSSGFFRLALKAKVDILPVSVVGAEEIYPLVYQAKNISSAIGIPSVPITPLFPILGPLGAFPLPSPIDVIIGRPYSIPDDLSPDAADDEIKGHVSIIENQIRSLTNKGLKNRRKFWGSSLLSQKKLIENSLDDGK